MTKSMLLLAAAAVHAFMLVNPFVSFGAGGGGGTSYANAGGTGDRTASITVTSNVLNSGTPSNLVDGASADNSTDSCDFFTNANGAWILFDFGAATYKVIDEITWYQSTTATHGTWCVDGSVDGKDFDELKSSFTLGGSVGANVISFTNTGGYRYYRLRQTIASGNVSSSPWLREVEFKIAAGSAATLGNASTYARYGGVGDRTGFVTVTTTATLGGGTIDNLVDGSRLNNAAVDNGTFAIFFNAGQSTREIKFDFGAGFSPKIQEITWFQDGTQNHGTWKFAGSNDDSSYTDLATGMTLGGAVETTYSGMSGNTTAYRYYKLIQTAGTTSSSPWIRECWFKAAS